MYFLQKTIDSDTSGWEGIIINYLKHFWRHRVRYGHHECFTNIVYFMVLWSHCWVFWIFNNVFSSLISTFDCVHMLDFLIRYNFVTKFNRKLIKDNQCNAVHVKYKLSTYIKIGLTIEDEMIVPFTTWLVYDKFRIFYTTHARIMKTNWGDNSFKLTNINSYFATQGIIRSICILFLDNQFLSKILRPSMHTHNLPLLFNTTLGTGHGTKSDEFSDKGQRGVIFNPKIYIPDFGPL